MFRNTIKGLDRVFQTNNYENMVILVSGNTGTLKSCFTYSMMSKYLYNNPDKIGLYATIEETEESLIRNLRSMGIERNERLHITDYNRIRLMFKEEAEKSDFVDLTNRMIDQTIVEYRDSFCVFALDSLNAFNTLADMDINNDYRKDCFFLFKNLRDKNLTSFIVKELSQNGPFIKLEDEVFLADGLIELGVRKTIEGKKRYIEVIKMKQNKHSLRQYIIDIDLEGISILGPSVDDILNYNFD